MVMNKFFRTFWGTYKSPGKLAIDHLLHAVQVMIVLAPVSYVLALANLWLVFLTGFLANVMREIDQARRARDQNPDHDIWRILNLPDRFWDSFFGGVGAIVLALIVRAF